MAKTGLPNYIGIDVSRKEGRFAAKTIAEPSPHPSPLSGERAG